jgi:hypothetical protein
VLAQSIANRAPTGRLHLACELDIRNPAPRRRVRPERIREHLRRLGEPLQDTDQLIRSPRSSVPVASAIAAPNVAHAVKEPSSTSSAGILALSRAGGDERVEIRLANPNPPFSDANCREIAGVDPVAHRLLVELEQLGDLSDGQELIWHTLNLIELNGRRSE